MSNKRYLGIVWPKKHAMQAALLAGYVRNGKVIAANNLVEFAFDYYPKEKRSYKKEFGNAIIGDFATRAEAEAAIENLMRD